MFLGSYRENEHPQGSDLCNPYPKSHVGTHRRRDSSSVPSLARLIANTHTPQRQPGTTLTHHDVVMKAWLATFDFVH
eukprot:gene5325-biopygen1680